MKGRNKEERRKEMGRGSKEGEGEGKGVWEGKGVAKKGHTELVGGVLP